MTATSVSPARLPFVSAVAGVSFRQEVVVSCSEEDELVAVSVSDNEYDPCAVEVRTSRTGEVCGFIPAPIAKKLRASGGEAWSCVVTEVLRGDLTGLRIKVLAETSEVVARYQSADSTTSAPAEDNPYSL